MSHVSHINEIQCVNPHITLNDRLNDTLNDTLNDKDKRIQVENDHFPILIEIQGVP